MHPTDLEFEHTGDGQICGLHRSLLSLDSTVSKVPFRMERHHSNVIGEPKKALGLSRMGDFAKSIDASSEIDVCKSMARVATSMIFDSCFPFECGQTVDQLRAIYCAYKLGWISNNLSECISTADSMNSNSGFTTVIPGRLFVARIEPCRSDVKKTSAANMVQPGPPRYTQQLQEMNITTIIRLHGCEFKDEEMDAQDVNNVACDFEGEVPSPRAVNLFLDTMSAHTTGVVLRCNGTKGRSLLFAAIHLMHTHGFDAAAAMAWLRRCSPGAAFTAAQADYLRFLDPARASANGQTFAPETPAELDAVLRERVCKAWRLYQDWCRGCRTGPPRKLESPIAAPFAAQALSPLRVATTAEEVTTLGTDNKDGAGAPPAGHTIDCEEAVTASGAGPSAVAAPMVLNRMG